MAASLTARELASRFTLEQLRKTYDRISVETIFVHGYVEMEFVIAAVKVTTTASRIGEAKLMHRGWVK